MVVSEITAGMGKEKSTGNIIASGGISTLRKLLGELTLLSLLTGLVMELLPMMVLAADLPTGGQIVGGQGSISTSGNQMTVHQQSQNMAANWHSFDIGKNNTVTFVQPNSSSVALNRVTGVSSSQIMGALNANGKIFILNPNGVLFGKDARVNVAGLLASTKNINTADFMKGQYTFSEDGNAGAQVINQGNLTTTKGGFIVLAADLVSNQGTITTPSGKTVLAAVNNITLKLDNRGLTSVSVNGSVVNALVENRGLISATNGQVYLTAQGRDMLLKTVVNNSGIIEAKGLNMDGGDIRLDGGGSGLLTQSGSLLADSASGRGGNITLEGQNIHLVAGSQTSAKGNVGGGEVHVGGGWQGKDASIRNASKVVMDKNATIDVSATQKGNGGTSVLWSDDYTNFRGTILAKGGDRSGNGGRVETSSHDNLQAFGAVDASSPSLGGKAGEWLLDPTDVTIVASDAKVHSDCKVTNIINDKTDTFSPMGSGAKILNTSITDQLNNGTTVIVKTSGKAVTSEYSGNITVNASIVKTKGADATLTLNADNNIVLGDKVNLSSSRGKLNLNMQAGNTSSNSSIVLGKFINISLNGGDFFAGNANGTGSVNLLFTNNGKIHGADVLMNISKGLNGYAYSILADNNLTINGLVNLNTGWGVVSTFKANNLLTINSPGSIKLQANEVSHGGGHVVISGDKGVTLNATNGGITLSSANGNNNSLNVTSSGGDINLFGSGGAGVGVNLINVNLTSVNMTINGTTTGTKPDSQHGDFGGVRFYQKVDLHIKGHGTITGNADNNTKYPQAVYAGGIVLGYLWGRDTQVLFDGKFNIKGEAKVKLSDKMLANNTAGIFFDSPANLTFKNDSSWTGVGENGALGMAGVYSDYHFSDYKSFNLENGVTLAMKLKSDTNAAIRTVPTSTANIHSNGYHFSGQGNVQIDAKSNSSGPTVYLNQLDNTHLTGNLSINATNSNGDAILVPGYVLTNLVNATISGHSQSGSGVKITPINHSGTTINLANNTITGTSNVADGININGNNVSITNGTLNGISNGSGVGVKLIGGNNYSLSGANVTGQSVNGSGVSASGNLLVNNNVTLTGTSSGAGNGVSVTGNMQSTGGVTINGTSAMGSGVSVSGNTALSNASVSGSSRSGSGVNISGQLKADSNTRLDGVSDSSTGLQLRGATVTNATLSGSSTNGSGVVITGDVSLDDTTAQQLNASSVNGVGLNLNDATVSIVNTSTTSPVTAPVQLNGTSVNGSGVTTSGNVSITGVTLNGSSSSDEGTGVTLHGNLTIADNISGVNAYAIGTGTGVELVGNVTGGSISGNSTGAGAGVRVSGNASTATNTTISGNTADGQGVVITGNLTNAGNSTVSGNSTGTGSGVVVNNGSVNGGQVSGQAVDGSGVHLSDGAVVSGVVVRGHSVNGSGINTRGNVFVQGGILKGTSTNGSNLMVSGSLKHYVDMVQANNVQGQDNIREVLPGGTLTEFTQSQSRAQRQGGVNAQISVMNGSSLRDLQTVGVPPVPMSGYQVSPQETNITLCDGDVCQSVTFDTSKPTKERVHQPEKGAKTQ